MKQILSSILGGIFALIVVSPLIAYNAISYGFLIMFFWKWFLMPIFPTLLFLTLGQAIGISLFIDLFKGIPASIKKEYKDDSGSVLAGSILRPWMLLLLGYLITLFI